MSCDDIKTFLNGTRGHLHISRPQFFIPVLFSKHLRIRFKPKTLYIPLLYLNKMPEKLTVLLYIKENVQFLYFSSHFEKTLDLPNPMNYRFQWKGRLRSLIFHPLLPFMTSGMVTYGPKNAHICPGWNEGSMAPKPSLFMKDAKFE